NKIILSKVNIVNTVKESENLLGNSTSDDVKSLDSITFLDVFDGVPQADISLEELQTGIDIVDVLNTKSGFLKSNGEARRALGENSIAVNREKVQEGFTLTTNDLINNRFVLLQRGKKNYFVLNVL